MSPRPAPPEATQMARSLGHESHRRPARAAVGRQRKLGDAVAAMLASSTKVGFEAAVGAVLRLLQDLDANQDLARFVRSYLSAVDGTHFLDAFYAPLLLRIHIVNVFAASVWTKAQFDFAGQFKMLSLWLNKILGWGLFAQVVGPDFATELVVYYKVEENLWNVSSDFFFFLVARTEDRICSTLAALRRIRFKSMPNMCQGFFCASKDSQWYSYSFFSVFCFLCCLFAFAGFKMGFNVKSRMGSRSRF